MINVFHNALHVYYKTKAGHSICVASLQKSPDVEKKIRFLLILVEQVMTNPLK